MPTPIRPFVVRVIHDDGDAKTTVATKVRAADTVFERMRGLMFRPPLKEEEGVAFRFDRVGTRRLHAVFVFGSFDAVWVAEGTVEAVTRLRPWIGYGSAKADLVLELPPGAAANIDPGDTILVEATGEDPTG